MLLRVVECEVKLGHRLAAGPERHTNDTVRASAGATLLILEWCGMAHEMLAELPDESLRGGPCSALRSDSILVLWFSPPRRVPVSPHSQLST